MGDKALRWAKGLFCGAMLGTMALFAAMAASNGGRPRHKKAPPPCQAEVALLLGRLPTAYQSLDEDGCLLDVNQAWLDILGYDRAEVIGRWFGDFLTADSAALFPGRFARFKQLGEVHGVEFEATRKDGAVLDISFEGRIARDAAGRFQRTHCVFTDITARKRAEEQARRNEARLASVVAILQRSYGSVQELLDDALDEAIKLTGSQIGYIYHYSEDRQEFTLNTWSKDVMSQCSIPNPPTVYQLEKTGIWGEAVRQRQHIIVNDFHAPHPLKKGYPQGHAPLHRFMTVPVLRGERIVGVVGVANKPTGYDDSDVLQLTLLMNAVWAAVERRQAEEAHARLEEELRQSQKMETVGRLAGGVAHDFNNMLTVILGYLDMVLSGLDPATQLYHDLREVQKAAQHSAELTEQLLGFSRKQIIQPRQVNLNTLVAAQQNMLARLIGEDIRLEFYPGAGLWPVYMDPHQVSQILTNLAANARDAIPGVGVVAIETSNVTVDDIHAARQIGLKPGDYVMLSFSDTGCGMDAMTRERAFEPFFTTKPVGQGTGLGLSTVYGIVKQNHGCIYVYSEPGQGTTFHIYLPRSGGDIERPAETAAAVSAAGGWETVLAVEDDEHILELIRRVLERQGYTVLAASTPVEACRAAEAHPGPIHLLLTDVVMPGMNGKELQARLRQRWPSLKTLYMSGYTANVIAHRGVTDPDVHFIQKPFAISALARRVRQVLDV